MIAVYNETRTPWDLYQPNDKAVCLTKVKTFNSGDNPMKRSTQIFGHSSIIGDTTELAATLKSKCINMRDVLVIADKPSSIMFSRKDYNPFLTDSDAMLKDILLITIDLKGRKVINVGHDNIFILGNFILGGEFTLIASLNRFDSVLRIKLWDEATNSVTVYSFGAENQPTLLITSEEPIGTEAAYVLHLKKFRPSRPTYKILALAHDIPRLKEIVDVEKHDIVSVTADTADDIIKSLVEDKYRAITFFTRNQLTNGSGGQYRDLANRLFTIFNLYYELTENGKIFKSKY